MRQTILLGVVVLGLPCVSWAQPAVIPTPTPATTRLVWSHDGQRLVRFEVRDELGALLLTLAPQTPQAGDYDVPFPALTPGEHVLHVSACNEAGCSAPASLPVRVIVAVPAPPTRLRVQE